MTFIRNIYYRSVQILIKFQIEMNLGIKGSQEFI